MNIQDFHMLIWPGVPVVQHGSKRARKTNTAIQSSNRVVSYFGSDDITFVCLYDILPCASEAATGRAHLCFWACVEGFSWEACSKSCGMSAVVPTFGRWPVDIMPMLGKWPWTCSGRNGCLDKRILQPSGEAYMGCRFQKTWQGLGISAKWTIWDQAVRALGVHVRPFAFCKAKKYDAAQGSVRNLATGCYCSSSLALLDKIRLEFNHKRHWQWICHAQLNLAKTFTQAEQEKLLMANASLPANLGNTATAVPRLASVISAELKRQAANRLWNREETLTKRTIYFSIGSK